MACKKYITTAEGKAILGISGEDTLVESLVEGASNLIDTLIASTGLETSVKSEFHALDRHDVTPSKRSTVFYLKTKNPTAVTSINGVSVGTINVDYIIEGQKLTLKDPATAPTAFPYNYKIVYTSGYTAIPEDIKLAVKYLLAGLYNSRKSQGIASFRQDLLSVNYNSDSILDTILDTEQKNFVKAIITKYSIVTIC